jgi:proteasome accessory factor A
VARALFGLESEYALNAFNDRGHPVDRREAVRKLVWLATRSIPNLPGATSTGIFLQNGSRLYVDAGNHPELSTPECSDPAEIVRYVHAGERLLDRVAREMAAGSRHIGQVCLLSCNVDYRSRTTWGSHESYHHRSDPTRLPDQLIPHLVTRILYTGAGGFDSRHPGIRFVISPRVPHLVRTVSRDSTRARGIFHTKDEALAKHGNHRLHLLCGESLRSHQALWLRVGTTALVVALVQAGHAPAHGLSLPLPLAAMEVFTGDVACKRRIAKQTAVQIQRRYLECAESNLGNGVLPAWAPDVCQAWRKVLDQLESAPEELDRTLDWRIKFALFTERARRQGMSWERIRRWNTQIESLNRAARNADLTPLARRERRDSFGPTGWINLLQTRAGDVAAQRSLLEPQLERDGLTWKELRRFLRLRQELFEIDTRFGQLGQDGIFARLDQAGVLDHRLDGAGDVEIETATVEPPRETRAWLRGRTIHALQGTAGRADWGGVWDMDRNRRLDLSDPFAREVEWKSFDAREFLEKRTRTLR